jgi:hypothetical protein
MSPHPPPPVERALVPSDALRHWPGTQIDASVVHRHLRQLHVAARHIDAAGQRVGMECARAVCVALACCSSPVQVK